MVAERNTVIPLRLHFSIVDKAQCCEFAKTQPEHCVRCKIVVHDNDALTIEALERRANEKTDLPQLALRLPSLDEKINRE